MPVANVSFVRRWSILGFFALCASLATLSGCGSGSKGGEDSVSGKVTMDGKPVAGQVVFVGSDKKESSSPIAPDGKYKIINAPKGQVQILIKGPAGGAAPTGAAGGAPKGAAPMDAGGTSGVAPPAKYATAAGGLTLEVKGGEQTHDIELKP